MPGFRTSNRFAAYPIADDCQAVAAGTLIPGVIADAAIDAKDDPAGACLLYVGRNVETNEPEATIRVGSVTLPLAYDRALGDYAVLAGSTASCFAELVVHDPSLTASMSFTLGHAPFAVGVAQMMPSGVTSLLAPALAEPHAPLALTDAVGMTDGYNVEVAPVASGIMISAGAGLGEGPVPCGSDLATGGVVGLNPDEDGNVNVVGGTDDCYQINAELDEDDPTAAIITIESKCAACCTCADYAAAYEKVATVADGLPAILTLLKGIDDKYNEPSFIDAVNARLSVTCDAFVVMCPATETDQGPRARSDHKARLLFRIHNRMLRAVIIDDVHLSLTKPTPVTSRVVGVPVVFLEIQHSIGDVAVARQTNISTIIEGGPFELPAGTIATISILVKANRYPTYDHTGQVKQTEGFVEDGAIWQGTFTAVISDELVNNKTASFYAQGITYPREEI